MTLAHFQAPDAPGFKLDPRVIVAFGRFGRGFWQGESAGVAWVLSLGLAACLLLSTAITVALNRWNRWFFDNLAARDVAGLTQAVFVFVVIIAGMAAVGVAIVLARETLQVRWRAWIVKNLVERWLGRQRFYHLNVSGREPPNPEYRISDDTRWATEPLVDLGIGLLLAVANGAAFIAILWSVGGSLSLALGPATVTIPAYMVILALLYGGVASGLMLWIGAPLVGLVGRKNEAEGHFRFAMMRIRDNAESVALMNGGGYEEAMLARFYETVVARWMAMVWQHGRLTWITNASGPMIPIVPLLFAAPKYVSGELTLGQVTQLAAAFVQVQIAISWLVDNYNRVAEWYASARRVMDIVTACDAIDVHIDRLDAAVTRSDAAAVALRDFEVADAAGRPLVAGAELVAELGQSLHICGESSTGKSSLVRVLAGLWPSACISLTLPDRARLMIAPQKSYLPLDSLEGALLYPNPGLSVSVDRLRAVLDSVGLDALAARLKEVARWDQVLSSGERQRLAIARLLVHRPSVVIIDDALSALDSVAQASLLARLRAELAGSTIIYLAQRPAALGDRQLALARGSAGAMLLAPAAPAMAEAT